MSTDTTTGAYRAAKRIADALYTFSRRSPKEREVQSLAAIIAEETRCGELEEALRPFASVADMLSTSFTARPETCLWVRSSSDPQQEAAITVGDVQRARAALRLAEKGEAQ